MCALRVSRVPASECMCVCVCVVCVCVWTNRQFVSEWVTDLIRTAGENERIQF